MMKMTLRNLMVATVASSLLLSACSSNKENDQQAKVTGTPRAPISNPHLNGGMAPEGARMPASNPNGDVGAAYDAAPAKDEGMFSWAYRDAPQPAATTAERRVPKFNQNPSAEFAANGMANYEAAAPVASVDAIQVQDAPAQDQWAAPHQEIIVAEELAVMDEPFTPAPMAEPQNSVAEGEYPSLASVPLRPERVEVIAEKDARMADMEAARAESMAQSQHLETQMAADGGWTPPAEEPVVGAQSDIDAEFAALVGAEAPAVDAGYGKVMTGDQYAQELAAAQAAPARFEAEAQEVVVIEQSQPWEMPAGAPVESQAPAPVEIASAPAPVMQSWEAVPVQVEQPAEFAPMVEPQTDVVAVQEGEWVSLQQDPAAQMAVPVEGVEVAVTPEVASVSAIPVVPVDDASGIQLTPPSTYGRAVRTLPESRYAARRQAVYMQRYARQVQADEGY